MKHQKVEIFTVLKRPEGFTGFHRNLYNAVVVSVNSLYNTKH